MKRGWTRALCFAAALLGASCAKPTEEPTEVLVVIDAEPEIRAETETLELNVRSLSSESSPAQNRVLTRAAANLSLPYTLALTPKGDDASRKFEVLVTARNATGLVAQVRAQSGYLAHRVLRLDLQLRDVCIAVSCGATETCITGGCGPAAIDVSTLPAFAGSSAPQATPIGADAGDDGGTSGMPALCGNAPCPCTDGATRSCDGTNNGECNRGFQACVGGVWQACEMHIGKAVEICDGLDNDCDGNLDNAVVCDPTLLPHTIAADCEALHGGLAGPGNKGCVPTQCDPDYADCNGDPSDGCEQNLKTQEACGACGTPCLVDYGTPTCATGRCEVAVCDADRFDCDAAGHSCETALNTVSNCGACGTSCTCANGTPKCGGVADARACEIYRCNSGYEDCDSKYDNGCEVDLNTDAEHCGTCDNDCTAKANVESSMCDAGRCAIGACATNYVDCDGDPSNGCEVDLTQDACSTCAQHTRNVGPTEFNGTVALDLTTPGTFTFDSTSMTWSPPVCTTSCPTPKHVTQPGASDLVVIPVSGLTIGSGVTVKLVGTYPVAFAVNGNATIAGILDASASADVPGAGGNAAACATAPSTGQDGVSQMPSSDLLSSGGGGGGFTTLGGKGGSNPVLARSGGNTFGSPTLSPLNAGCRGGFGNAGAPCSQQAAGAGGGGVQLSVAGILNVTGSIRANGGTAAGPAQVCIDLSGRSAGSGGGSGGAILLEAVVFSLDVAASFPVNGGAGSVGTSGALAGAGSTSAIANGSAGLFTSPAGSGGGGGYGRVVTHNCLH